MNTFGSIHSMVKQKKNLKPPFAPTITFFNTFSTQIILYFTLGYNGGSNVTTYEYSLNNSNTWSNFTVIINNNFASGIISGLTANTSYNLKIRVNNIVGNGAESSPISFLTNNYSPPIDSLSSDTKDVMLSTRAQAYEKSAGIYGVRLLYSNYTGPIMKIRRGNDNIEKDFYYNINADNLVTDDGTTLNTSWLNNGFAIAYVTTWYDQSGNQNHATQTTTTYQPVYNLTNKYVEFSGSRFFNLPDGTHPYGDSHYTYVFKCSIYNVQGTVFSGGDALDYYDAPNAYKRNSFYRFYNEYINNWNANYIGTYHNNYSNNSVITTLYNGSQRIIYQNEAVAAGPESNSGREQPNTYNFIGKGFANLNGYIAYMYIIPIAISDSDRTILEKTVA